MSDGTTTRGPTAKASFPDRPARLQALREAQEADRADEAAAAPVAPPAWLAPTTAPVDEPSRPGRAGIVFAAVAAMVLVAVGAFVVFGRSSSDGAAPVAAPSASVAGPVAGVAPSDAALDTATVQQRTEALCRATQIYSIDDLLQLGKNIVAEPEAFLAAYDTMVANSPEAQRVLLEQMGPLTRKAVAEVRAGTLTSDVQVQAWLAASPPAELEAWVGPQQALAPALADLCA